MAARILAEGTRRYAGAMQSRTSPAPAAGPSLPHGLLLVALVASICSAGGIGNGFTVDDWPVIVRNPAVTEPGRHLDVWLKDYWQMDRQENRDLLYRPLSVETYRLQHSLHGLWAPGYHAVNIALHVGVTLLLVLSARRLGLPGPGPWIAGLLFAVMPIHVEAVAGIVGRAELLAAGFMLAGLLAAERAAREPRPWLLAGAAACVLLALLSKESGAAAVVLVPATLLLTGGKGRSKARWLTAAAIAAVPLAIYLPLRWAALGGRLAEPRVNSQVINQLVDVHGLQRLYGILQLFGLYLFKSVWPATLCWDYSWQAVRLAESPAHPLVLLGLAGLICVAGLAAWSVRRRRFGLLLCCLGLLAAYAPISNVVFLIKTFFAERAWYVASAFECLLIAWGLAALPQGRGLRPVVAGVLAAAVIVGAVRSSIRTTEWYSNETVFKSGYQVHPDSALVLLAWGRWLSEHGDPGGIEILRRSVAIAPSFTPAHIRLGAALLADSRPAEAVYHLQIAEMEMPGDKLTRDLLNRARADLAQRHAAGLAALERGWQEKPRNLEAFLRYTQALVDAGLPDKARGLFDEQAATFGGQADFHAARAATLMLLGQVGAGMQSYRDALTAAPDRAELMAELAMALIDRHAPGDLAEADRLIETATRLAPNHLQVLVARAEWLALGGRKAEAAAIYRKLIPTVRDPDFRRTLEARLKLVR